MNIDQQAAELVAATDPAAVAAVIAAFPSAEEIGIRERWQDLNPHLGERVPKAPAAREAYLLGQIDRYQKSHLAGVSHYNKLRAQGLAALSPYDLCISSGNDPLGALRCALRLKDAHISYDLSILVKLSLELEDVRTELADAEPPQLALF